MGEAIDGGDTHDDAYTESPNAGTLMSTTEVPLLAVRASRDVEDPACAGGDKASRAFFDAFDRPEGEASTFDGLGVTAARSRDVAEAVAEAWASAFTVESVIRRRVAGVTGATRARASPSSCSPSPPARRASRRARASPFPSRTRLEQ